MTGTSVTHFGNGSADEAGIVIDHFDGHIFRKVFLQLFDTFVGLVCNFNLISSGLRDDHVDDHRFAVLTHDTAHIFRRDFRPSDILEADNVVSVPLDD